MTVRIVHDPNALEFFADIDGQRPVLQYRYADRVMTITHTRVPEALGHRGIAAELTRAALEFARGQGWKVEPACSYARAFMERNAQYADLLASHRGDSPRQHQEALLDEALEESFPASDVPAIGGDD